MNATNETPDPARLDFAQTQMHGLLARSATDLKFRNKLLSNPRAGVAEFLGTEVPESFDLVFLENKGDATIVLPDPVDVEAALPESELNTVSGGWTPTAFAIAAGVLAIYDAVEDKYCGTSCF